MHCHIWVLAALTALVLLIASGIGHPSSSHAAGILNLRSNIQDSLLNLSMASTPNSI
jgi:hypothetical protein